MKSHFLLPYFYTAMMLSSILLCSACATNPASGSHDFVLMSEKQELRLGQQYSAQLGRTLQLLPDSDPLAQYVNHVGQKVAQLADRSDLYYHFYVVDDATINAFALPGGYIYLHRGLLVHLNSEAELAAVLGHEIGHVTARHTVKQYTKSQSYRIGMAITSIFVPVSPIIGQFGSVLATAIIRGYGREYELESDTLAVRYLKRAGYDVIAIKHLLQTLKRLETIDKKEQNDAGEKTKRYHGAFSTHPKTEERIIRAVQQEKSGGFLGHDVMLQAIKGYPYRDNDQDGAIIGQRFIHPKLGIQLQFPDGWFIKNTPSALTARLKKEKVFFRLSIEELVKRETSKEVLQRMITKSVPKADIHIQTSSQAGYEYAHTVVNMAAPQVRRARVHMNVWRKDSQVLHMLMWTDANHYTNVEQSFQSIASSFQPYLVIQDGDIPRVHLRQWQTTDSWNTLAQQHHNLLGSFTAQRFAALNGMTLEETPNTGQWIKLAY